MKIYKICEIKSAQLAAPADADVLNFGEHQVQNVVNQEIFEMVKKYQGKLSTLTQSPKVLKIRGQMIKQN